ncbi:DUF6114 domain-containing protein [Halorientalis pallida]|uniref:Uncharacterized protein n=1 Tax=Halorientalis pallida TaxID=2479928 RepID=A0A498L654_9EURY|nr:DUF6114 domain-containing protein [Halorientalis pallida]RXK51762.1 hypothetical protein EAF64_03770 [Halorientalis pallida]
MSEWVTRAGGGVLWIASVIIGAVPVVFRAELAVIGGSFTILGLVFAALVGACGLVALARPGYALCVGPLGVLFSLLSMIGALGGLFVGMFLGILGGLAVTVSGGLQRSESDSDPA